MIALKTAGALLGPPLRALPWVVIGGGWAVMGALQARQPDSVLSSIALENARVCASSAGGERDSALVILALGVAVAIYGLYRMSQWIKALRAGAA